jgi:hypothetical protein
LLLGKTWERERDEEEGQKWVLCFTDKTGCGGSFVSRYPFYN